MRPSKASPCAMSTFCCRKKLVKEQIESEQWINAEWKKNSP